MTPIITRLLALLSPNMDEKATEPANGKTPTNPKYDIAESLSLPSKSRNVDTIQHF